MSKPRQQRERSAGLEKSEELQQETLGDHMESEAKNVLPQDAERPFTFKFRAGIKEIDDHLFAFSSKDKIKKTIGGIIQALKNFYLLTRKIDKATSLRVSSEAPKKNADEYRPVFTFFLSALGNASK